MHKGQSGMPAERATSMAWIHLDRASRDPTRQVNLFPEPSWMSKSYCDTAFRGVIPPTSVHSVGLDSSDMASSSSDSQATLETDSEGTSAVLSLRTGPRGMTCSRSSRHRICGCSSRSICRTGSSCGQLEIQLTGNQQEAAGGRPLGAIVLTPGRPVPGQGSWQARRLSGQGHDVFCPTAIGQSGGPTRLPCQTPGILPLLWPRRSAHPLVGEPGLGSMCSVGTAF